MTRHARFAFLFLSLASGALSACGRSAPLKSEAAGSGGAIARTCEYEGDVFATGQSFPSADGCNTCTCSPDGVACTERACTPAQRCGARAGDSCAEHEYCAYVPGQMCGQADAEATCAKRPDACDANYQPVCGCDGTTYGNACAAHLAGSGVFDTGECTQAK